MKQFLKFLTKIKSFWKFYQNYEYDGETVEFIIDNYQDVLQNRTKLMSKPTYYANDVIKQIDNWYEEMGYECVRNPHKKVKQIYDRFETALSDEELAELILRLDVDLSKINSEQLWEYMQKKEKYLKAEVSTHD